jgi:hypothetical protein
MSDVVMLEAALFQLRSAASSVSDPFLGSQLQLTLGVVAHAVDGVAQSLSAASVNDLEFALNDLAGVADQLSGDDEAAIAPVVAMMRDDVARLKEATSLPATVLAAIAALQTKLKARRSAIERQLYRTEGTPEQPLPHPPEELREEAMPLREALATAGFSTPALDALIVDPSSLVFQSLRDISDELEVITG